MSFMTGYLYDAEGTRVAKGTITSMSCDPAVNGFQTTTDYVLGLGGEQVTEMGVDANGTLAHQHTNVWAGGSVLPEEHPEVRHAVPPCHRPPELRPWKGWSAGPAPADKPRTSTAPAHNNQPQETHPWPSAVFCSSTMKSPFCSP